MLAMANIAPIFVGDLETGNLSQFPDQQNGYKNERSKVAVTTDNPRSGKYAMSATLYRDDWLQHTESRDMKHVDILNKNNSTKFFETRYYGFSIMIPSEQALPNKGFIVTQWHDKPDPGEDWKSPFLSLSITPDGRWGGNIRFDPREYTPHNQTQSAGVWINGERPLVTKGQWTDWVVKLNEDYRTDGNGEVQIWMRVGGGDWKQVGKYFGPVGFNDDHPGWWGGHGLYFWEPPQVSKLPDKSDLWSSSIPYLRVYHDEYRMGYDFDDVAPPRSDVTPPPPPPPPTEDFTIYGTSGNDTLTGGSSGKFTLIGGKGDDVYIVDADDIITEVPGEGVDTIKTSVNYTMTDNYINNLTLTGSAVSGVGNSYNNLITGNGVNNNLTGGAGNDTLIGGGGADHFIFKAKGEGIDQITDFSGIKDTIAVSAAGFGSGLISGKAISTNQWVIGAAATSASQRFIYNSSNGNLFFDADGNGANAPLQLATLSSKPVLTNNDIFVIA